MVIVKDDAGEMLQFENEKLKALLEILEETDQKVIIWATYIHNIHEINKALSEKYGSESVVSIYGAYHNKIEIWPLTDFKKILSVDSLLVILLQVVMDSL